MRSMQTRATRQGGGRPPTRQPQTAPVRLSLSPGHHSGSFSTEGRGVGQLLHAQTALLPWQRSLRVCRCTARRLCRLLPVQELRWRMWCQATGKMSLPQALWGAALLDPAAGRALTQHLREGSRRDVGCSVAVLQLTLWRLPSAAGTFIVLWTFFWPYASLCSLQLRQGLSPHTW